MADTPHTVRLRDRGTFTLDIEDAAGLVATKELDLWQVNNRLYQMQLEFEGKPLTDFHAAVVQYLTELGFPTCSQMLADEFVGAIRQAVAEAKKKAGSASPSAASPASTASTSAA